ncbi:MAG: low specificity L-threonine aldolase [Alphaproteobacteria bacterium]|nr:low specificity L-threonine aldolase [Alphaproteobacteria bacterium]
MHLNFTSDNASGIAPRILRALAEANAGPAMAYGADAWTQACERSFAQVFEHEVACFPLATGTAANALALAALVPPYGAILCHRDAHIAVDECGAPEFHTGGAKLLLLDGAHARLSAAGLDAALAGAAFGVEHHVQPAAVSLTQASEAGTVYRPAEIAELAAIAHRYRCQVHMDGARFANAVASLGASPADVTWRAGVDVLSFGATKNGALAAEAVLFFRPELAAQFRYRRKRAGHLLSKQRFLSAQLTAYLADGAWLADARHANAQARQLAEGLASLPGVTLAHPTEANEVFAELPETAIGELQRQGVGLHRWQGRVVRLVTAFDTDPAAVDRVLTIAAGASARAAV